METLELLKRIVACPTPSGRETDALPLLRELLSPYTKNVTADPFGNVKAAFGSGEVLLEAHLDKIGLIVTHVYENGFLRVAPVGGVDARVLPAEEFVVLTDGGEIPAVGASVPPHLASEEDRKSAKKIDEALLDAGLENAGRVRPGDRVLYAAPLRELAGGRVCAPYLDNSVGVCVLLLAAKYLAEQNALDGVTLCFAAQEETGCRGASPAVYGGNYREAIAVDTSFASAPGVKKEQSGKLGGGTMIGFSPVLNASLSREFRALAEELEIPHTSEVMGGSTGTDADNLARAGTGIPTALLSVPIRNMHTPSEICALEDIENAAALIAAHVIRGRE